MFGHCFALWRLYVIMPSSVPQNNNNVGAQGLKMQYAWRTLGKKFFFDNTSRRFMTVFPDVLSALLALMGLCGRFVADLLAARVSWWIKRNLEWESSTECRLIGRCREDMTGNTRGAEAGEPGQTYNIGGQCQWTNFDLVKLICNKLDAGTFL